MLLLDDILDEGITLAAITAWCREQGADEVLAEHFAEDMPLQRMVLETKTRWRIERDYQDFKQCLGLGDYEGRG